MFEEEERISGLFRKIDAARISFGQLILPTLSC